MNVRNTPKTHILSYYFSCFLKVTSNWNSFLSISFKYVENKTALNTVNNFTEKQIN